VTAFSSGNSTGDYVVQEGDTLKSIAQAVYGNASLWYVIAQANALGGAAAGSLGTVAAVGAAALTGTAVAGVATGALIAAVAIGGLVGNAAGQLAVANCGAANVSAEMTGQSHHFSSAGAIASATSGVVSESLGLSSLPDQDPGMTSYPPLCEGGTAPRSTLCTGQCPPVECGLRVRIRSRK
jgi:hypothetical protein